MTSAKTLKTHGKITSSLISTGNLIMRVKIAFSPKQYIIALYDYIFFYTRSVTSLISTGDLIISYNSKLCDSFTKTEIIEYRINFVDRRMERVEKLIKLRKRSILWFTTFLIFTALFFYFTWMDNLYARNITHLACTISSILSIPLVRLHSFFENDIRSRLTKYRNHLCSELNLLSKKVPKQNSSLQAPIVAEANMTGVLFFLFVKNNLMNNKIPTSTIKSIFSNIFSKKNGSNFVTDSFKNPFVLTKTNYAVWKLYDFFIEQLKINSSKINNVRSEVEPEVNQNTERLFYQLKNSRFEFKTKDEELKVILKIFCHTIISNKETPIQLDKNEQISLKHVIKSHF
ncbi:hypothetical protein DF185_09170 [Marinifilum breve]|uniref:Uncharacterized protein n=1 Tax=Marinifilum breve TaxID=2184082 RepID=A0A2V4A2R9_9BACT|nr:hypothetical protein [Marinifilum breve]PXY01630.1 hypothetical protein DF185_09170 [Marinifilum breve]